MSRLLPLAFGLLGVAFAAWTLAAFAIAAFYGGTDQADPPGDGRHAGHLDRRWPSAPRSALRQHYQAPLTDHGGQHRRPGAWALGNYD